MKNSSYNSELVQLCESYFSPFISEAFRAIASKLRIVVTRRDRRQRGDRRKSRLEGDKQSSRSAFVVTWYASPYLAIIRAIS